MAMKVKEKIKINALWIKTEQDCKQHLLPFSTMFPSVLKINTKVIATYTISPADALILLLNDKSFDLFK